MWLHLGLMFLFISGNFLELLIQMAESVWLGKVTSTHLTVQAGSGLFLKRHLSIIGLGNSEGAKLNERRGLALVLCPAWETVGSGGYGATLETSECAVCSEPRMRPVANCIISHSFPLSQPESFIFFKLIINGAVFVFCYDILIPVAWIWLESLGIVQSK